MECTEKILIKQNKTKPRVMVFSLNHEHYNMIIKPHKGDPLKMVEQV